MNRAEDLHHMGIRLIREMWQTGLVGHAGDSDLLDGVTWEAQLHNALKEDGGSENE